MIVEHQKDSPNVDVFYAVSKEESFRFVFFPDETCYTFGYFPTVTTCADYRQFVFRQETALPFWKLEIHRYLSERRTPLMGGIGRRQGCNDSILDASKFSFTYGLWFIFMCHFYLKTPTKSNPGSQMPCIPWHKTWSATFVRNFREYRICQAANRIHL